MSDTLGATAALLREVFPGAGVGDLRYLRWLYEASPFGLVVESNLDDDHGRVAHYAVVPAEFRCDGRQIVGSLSLNTAVHDRGRGGGVFVKLASETFDKAASRGIQLVVGVANANSTPGFERRLGFTNHGQLKATFIPPRPGPKVFVRSGSDTGPATLFDEIEPILLSDVGADGTSGDGLRRTWSIDALRWRLQSPLARYAIHHVENALIVTTGVRRGPANVAVILAGFAASPVPARTRSALVRAACRFHRAPVALHVGHNDRFAFSGIPLPERFRPSPLNFITRILDSDSGLSADAVTPSRFELLDFDAY